MAAAPLATPAPATARRGFLARDLSTRVRILVVDDNAVFREEFAELLTDEGHTVSTAASVPKAVESLESEEFEVVFTDLKMPRQSGIDLLRIIRERWPHRFVIMVTGFATVATAVEAMKLGAFDYIAKPFRADQVRSVLGLVSEQLRYAGPGLQGGHPVDLARDIAERQGVPVLLAAPAPAPTGLPPSISFVPFDGKDPAALRDQVESFLRDHPKAGVVIAHAEQALALHRTEDITSWLASLRTLLQGRGVLAVGMDPTMASEAQLEAVTATLAAPALHGALEAVANPIRRRILRRLSEGPASFSTLMRSAELDDSPKMSFHMHRLVESGLVAHTGEEYQLTPRGEGTTSALRDLEATAEQGSEEMILFRPRRAARRAS
jgi:ActR/RegA family two-component response regulator/DNA-binding HxlR family transcriptional regulator